MAEIQNINWFPGHMAKTRRLISESLKLVDGVVEIVDARIPVSSRNPDIGELVKDKPRIVILNKADVADERETVKWADYFNKSGCHAMLADCRSGKGLNRLTGVVSEALASVTEKKCRARDGRKTAQAYDSRYTECWKVVFYQPNRGEDARQGCGQA